MKNLLLPLALIAVASFGQNVKAPDIIGAHWIEYGPHIPSTPEAPHKVFLADITHSRPPLNHLDPPTPDCFPCLQDAGVLETGEDYIWVDEGDGIGCYVLAQYTVYYDLLDICSTYTDYEVISILYCYPGQFPN